MKKLLSIVLCVVLCFSLFSCKEQGQENKINTPDAQIINNNDPYSFEKVADLLTAIKKNLDQYENMQVSVKGSILKGDDYIILADARGDGGAKFSADARKSANITITMLNDKITTVLDNGDYVKISGTVKISDTGIYLDNCDYKMIESIYE